MTPGQRRAASFLDAGQETWHPRTCAPTPRQAGRGCRTTWPTRVGTRERNPRNHAHRIQRGRTPPIPVEPDVMRDHCYPRVEHRQHTATIAQSTKSFVHQQICRVSRSTTSGGRLDLGFCNCLTAAAPAFVSRTGSIPTNPTHADTARSERRDSRNRRLDDGELDAPLAADQFDASDETLIRRFRELTADDFAEGLAVAVAEAERNRDEGTAE